jgi:ribonuclease HI
MVQTQLSVKFALNSAILVTIRAVSRLLHTNTSPFGRPHLLAGIRSSRGKTSFNVASSTVSCNTTSLPFRLSLTTNWAILSPRTADYWQKHTPRPHRHSFSSPKMAPKTKFYAVQRGRNPGVYTTWDKCQAEVKGFPGAVCKRFKRSFLSLLLTVLTVKSFPSMDEAKSFVGAGASVNVFREETPATRTTSKTMSTLSSGSQSSTATTPTDKPRQYWAIKVGKIPGIYTSWTEAKAQLTGTVKPEVKHFTIRERAEAWMRGELDNPEHSKVSDTGVKPTTTRAKTELHSVPPLPQLAGTKRKLAAAKPAAMSIAKQQKMSTLATTTDTGLSALLAAEKTKYANLKPGMDSLPPARSDPLTIYTDGSALGNGKNGARAGVGVYFGPNDSR